MYITIILIISAFFGCLWLIDLYMRYIENKDISTIQKRERNKLLKEQHKANEQLRKEQNKEDNNKLFARDFQ